MATSGANSTGGRSSQERINPTMDSISSSSNGPPFEVPNGDMPKLGCPWVMIDLKVISSRVFKYSAVLMGAMISPVRVGLGPPSPRVPWQVAQYCVKRVLPTATE